MAYGSPEGVAALASIWTDEGSFTNDDLYETGTTPTLEQVEQWLEELSVFVDIALSGEGFTVPISHVDLVKAIGLKVNTMAADLVHLQHSKGRLFSDRIQESGTAPMTILEREILAWVNQRVAAFENYGIPRVINFEDTQGYSIPATRQK